MNFYYNPLDKKCKSEIGAVKSGQAIKISVYGDFQSLDMAIISDKTNQKLVYGMLKTVNGFTVDLKIEKAGLYWYYFVSGGFIYGRDDGLNISSGSLDKFQLLIYNDEYALPENYLGGVIYQIFPDRFNIGVKFIKGDHKIFRKWGEQPYYKPDKNGKILNDDFFGGNLAGIEEKLPYLKSLGVTAIYLNPITKAFSNHRYDTSDYLKIDETLGTEEDFARLAKSAKSLGISLIIDGVFNHTGDDSVYFNKYGHFSSLGAYQSKKSPYYNWYTFEKFPDKYKCWWGIDTLPTINKESVEFEDFIAGENGVIEKYLKLGASGIRLDVVDELPPAFVKKIRERVKTVNPEAIIIGEVWEDATNKIAYGSRREYFAGKELDSVMNYPLKNAIISYLNSADALPLSRVIKEQLNNYPHPALNLLMNILDTHDTPRILTVLGLKNEPKTREEMARTKLSECELFRAIKKLKVAAVLEYTLYGLPSLYYGDEVLTEGEKDPFNRTCFDWGKLNKPCEIFELYKKLGEIRANETVFKRGETEVIYSKDGAFSFRRFAGDEEIIVVVNAGEYVYSVNLDNTAVELLSGKISKKFTIEGVGALVLKPLTR